MSYDPPTIMDKLHDIARVLGVYDLDDCCSLALNVEHMENHARDLLAIIPIAERIAVALERLADKHAPRTTPGVCLICNRSFDDWGKHLRDAHPDIDGPPA